MSTDPDRDAILDLIVRWEEARARGITPSPEALCESCPDLLSGFRREVEKLGDVDWLNGPIDSSDATTDPAPDVTPDRDLPRTIAERYRLDHLIGEGGFGRVYRAHDTWLERPVAVKIPRVDRPVTGGEVDQCQIEARKVARLRHPNIVSVHDVGRDGSTCFIVGEWIDGKTLSARMREGPVDFRDSARIAREIAQALAHAHDSGFFHRDVKPANILLDAAGRAYLTDFGIAVVAEDLLHNVNTAGTLANMAPEQLDDSIGPVDHRADLYSLGIVIHELLTGRRPFRAASPAELGRLILTGLTASPRSARPDIPEILERICVRCLARNPIDRYPHARELVADLALFVP